jgi:hypothetical protein
MWKEIIVAYFKVGKTHNCSERDEKIMQDLV